VITDIDIILKHLLNLLSYIVRLIVDYTSNSIQVDVDITPNCSNIPLHKQLGFHDDLSLSNGQFGRFPTY
jgi:hypothetical protein